MIRRPPRSTLSSSSAASDVYKRQDLVTGVSRDLVEEALGFGAARAELAAVPSPKVPDLLAQQLADGPTRARTRSGLLASLALEQQNLALPLVVTISRIAAQKNLPVLVGAASRVRNPCNWVVLGDGDPQMLAQLQ